MTTPSLPEAAKLAHEALVLAEDVLSHRPYSSELWPDGTHPNTGITKIREAIAALSASPEPTEPVAGMVLVPREPTPAMIAAYWDCIEQHMGSRSLLEKAGDRYKAMLSAAPTAAQAEPPEGHLSDESTMVDLWAEIHRLRAAVKGPDGYASWQDAAVDERIRRVRAEKTLADKAAQAEPSAQEPAEDNLDPRTAYEYGQQMSRYCESFNGQEWSLSTIGNVDRKNLAVALDNLTECAAMLMNQSDRLLDCTLIATPSTQDSASVAGSEADVGFTEAEALAGALEHERVESYATQAAPVAAAPDTLRAGQDVQAAPEGWRPIDTAPENVRVLLGPRDAPVVGTVSHPVPWEEGDLSCCVVHYNGNTLVAGYHCSEWHALPAPTSPGPGATPPVQSTTFARAIEAARRTEGQP